MQKLTGVLVLAALFVTLAGSALAESEFNLYAEDKRNGKPAAAGSYGWNVVILSLAQWQRLNAGNQARYNITGEFCGQRYFMSQYAKDWIEAHGRYDHELVIKERRDNGSLVTICK